MFIYFPETLIKLVKLFFHQNSDRLNFLRPWLRIIAVSFIMQCSMGNILLFWTDQSQWFCLRAAPSHDLSPEVCCFSQHPTSAFSAHKTTDSITACSVSLSLSFPIYSFFPPSAQADWKRSSKLISQTCDFQFQTPDTNPTHTLNIHAEGPELRHHRCPNLRSPNHTHLISLFKETGEREREAEEEEEEEGTAAALFIKRWKS